MDEILTISDEEYLRIITTVRTVRDVDLTVYQPILLRHRFARFTCAHGYRSVSIVIEKLRTDKIFVDMFLKEIRINTTEMFRDPQMWTELEQILTQKLSQESVLKIWVPDINGDDELNSLLVILERNNLLHKSTVYATSPYQRCLEECQQGSMDAKKYEISEANFKRMDTQNTLEKYIRHTDKYYTFSEDLLKKAIYLKQSIICDSPPDKGFTLILLRNRTLAYNNSTRRNVLAKLTQSLQSGGYLIIGIGENLNGLDQENMYIPVSKTENIYRKK